MTTSYILGLDLGQAHDYTALVILEKHQNGSSLPDYHARHIDRFPLGTPYPVMVEKVCNTYGHPLLRTRERTLVVDYTGAGRPVADMLKPCGPITVSIHGGDTVHRTGRHYRVPKRDLVSVAQVLLQQRRLKLAEALPLTAILEQELLSFRMKIDPLTAHDSFSAWRERDHDDLVLATALAVWWGEKAPKPGRVALIDLPQPRPWWL
jgi:hypothetical protein